MSALVKDETCNPDTRIPRLFRATDPQQIETLNDLISHPSTMVIDRISHQLTELIKINHVGQSLGAKDIEEKVSSALSEDPKAYGCWVYYPWNHTLIHLLERDDFIKVRTNRNRNKISEEEQRILEQKKVGIIGMSVGRAVATTMALERAAGTIKIADFDTLDLSNLNRLKAPLRDLGLKKTVSVAREIMEIDPFLNLICDDEGFTEHNGLDFLTKDGKLDVLVDECDSLEVKILCREWARKHQIPVVMETSDRGMLDIERFDLEPDRPIFHGKLEGLDLSNRPFSANLRTEVLMKIVDFENLSEKARLSLPAVGKTLLTWPQLASSVVLGGGTVTNTVRQILLGNPIQSGRHYIDMDQIISR